MGFNLNKLSLSSSTSGGDGDGDSSRIVQLLAIFAIGTVLVSSFAGPVAAGSATSVNAQDYTEGDSQQVGSVNGLSLNSSETVMFESNATGIDYSSVSTSDITVSGANITVQGIVEASNGQLTIHGTADEAISGADVTVYIDGQALTVNSEGTGTFSADPGDDGVTVEDSFNYSLQSPATGTVELGNISTWDNESVDQIDSVMIYNSSGDRVVNQDNITDFENYSEELETGDYTYTLVADGYADADGNFSVTENNTTALNPEFGPVAVDYEFTIEQDGEALDNTTFSIYDGDTIGDNESPLQTVDLGSANTVTVTNLYDGDTQTVEVTYTDADGNETTYTEVITVDSSQAENGTVSQTVDVASDSTSDDSSFIGSYDNPFSGLGDQLPDDPVVLVLTAITGFVAFVGTLFTLLWVKNGLKFNNL
jgi:hypothetical protein